MIYGFAKQSEGQVRIYSELGEGTTVKIYLPRQRGKDSEEPASEESHAMPGAEAGETVLVVDDEPTVRMLIGDTLAELGYESLEAADAARVSRPNLKVLFITGYAENAAISNGHLEPGMHVMSKPFAMESLATRIRSIIEE
jgi:CheY-like chemotaxis protein